MAMQKTVKAWKISWKPNQVGRASGFFAPDDSSPSV